MAEQKQSQQEVSSAPPAGGLSLDWWAVIAALALAALILVGLIPAVPW